MPSNRTKRDRLWNAGQRNCYWCEKSLKKSSATIDHLLAIGDGGAKSDSNNLVIACKKCNNGRSSAKSINQQIESLERRIFKMTKRIWEAKDNPDVQKYLWVALNKRRLQAIAARMRLDKFHSKSVILPRGKVLAR